MASNRGACASGDGTAHVSERRPGKENISLPSRSAQRFSHILRAWRLASDRKISDAAGEFGVAASTWGHWETGRRFPTVDKLDLLSEFTGIPAQCLICPCCDLCPKQHSPVCTGKATEYFK